LAKKKGTNNSNKDLAGGKYANENHSHNILFNLYISFFVCQNLFMN